jgi:small GTP-binding protein
MTWCLRRPRGLGIHYYRTELPANPQIVVCGDFGIGKTAFVNRLRSNRFDARASMIMIGTPLNDHNYQVDINGTFVSLSDTAGQEKFNSLTPIYFRNADVAIFAYDVTNKESLANLAKHYEVFRAAALDNCKVVIVGLKSDRKADTTVDLSQAEEVGKRFVQGAEFVAEVSSLTGEGMDAFKQKLVDLVGTTQPKRTRRVMLMM